MVFVVQDAYRIVFLSAAVLCGATNYHIPRGHLNNAALALDHANFNLLNCTAIKQRNVPILKKEMCY